MTREQNDIQTPLQVLSRSFNFASSDEAKWWHSTAPMFATLMEKSSYDVHAQYQFLCLHREFVIPALGPYPTKGGPMHWKSTLTRFGLPFELSFNYTKSLVRFAFEPLGPLTGTDEDPFNTQPISQCLKRFKTILPKLDLEWFDLFIRELVVSDEDVKVIRDKNLPVPIFKTQNKLAADLGPNGDMLLKTYIYPRIKAMANGVPKEQLMFNAIRKADTSGKLAAPLSVLEEFMGSRETLIAHFLSCDLVKPSESRIKLYCFETQLDFETIAGIWTLDGRRTDPETLAGLNWLKDLWQLLPIAKGRASLPNRFYELGESPVEQLPFIINFALYPNKALPEPQIYFPVFGNNDKATAEGLATFFDRVGVSSLPKFYAPDLAAYYPDQDLAQTNHHQAWISYATKANKPYMSVYMHSFEATGQTFGAIGKPAC
ncbi:Aromatic prenyltransferase DMATS type [Penicillium cf. griseofulvum]|nr:Aromatic prenyltransferase DMATS type [Penicillium cf. griseofulvum]